MLPIVKAFSFLSGFAAFCAITGAAAAADCESLQAALNGFADGQATSIELLASSDDMPEAQCDTFGSTDALPSGYCLWEFDYRVPASERAFGNLTGTFDDCFGIIS